MKGWIVLGREELKYKYDGIVGESPSLVACLKEVDQAVDSDAPVLIIGESGTGKELLAKAIWQNSSRKSGKFVSENCAAISELLLDNELFGYFSAERQKRKKGLIEIADKGVLFLDEVSELTLDFQEKIFLAFERGHYRLNEERGNTFGPLGVHDLKEIAFNARLISATNRDLDTLVKEGRFNRNLYDYISQIRITVPPLRERKEDIPLLLNYFLEKIAREKGGAKKEVSPGAMELLQSYDWPGNVRELANECTRIYTLSGDRISIDDVSPRLREEKEEEALKKMMRAGVRERIRSYFAEHPGLEKRLDALADSTMTDLDLRPAEAAITQILKMDGRVHIPKELVPYFIAYYQEAVEHFAEKKGDSK